MIRCVVLAAVLGVGSTAWAQSVMLTQGTNLAAAATSDATRIAIDLQGTIWTLPAAGGAATSITDPMGDARQPAWSPDGARLAFQSYRDGGWHIWAVDAAGANLTQLTRGGFDDREPVYSPDGAWIAFASDRSGSYDVWVMRADGSDLRQLTASPANEFAPTWSPDGAALAYASDRDGGKGIYRIAATGVAERLLAEADGALGGLAWSPDGRSILFVATGRDASTLKRLDVSSAIISDISAAGEDVFGFRPSWLSATTVLYTADAALKRRDLAVPQAAPGAAPGAAPASAPAVIPFTAAVELARPAYARKAYDFDTPGPRPVKGMRGPVVAPDGATVAFAALGDIWLADRAGTARRLTDDAALDYDPAWSADGRSIAFVSDRSGKTEIWAHDLASGAQRQLTRTATEVQFPSWSPDGTRIAFFQVLGLAGLGGGSLHVLDLGANTVTQLRPSIWGPGRASWSPDGSKITLAAVSPSSSRFREGYSAFLVAALADATQDKFVTPHPDRSLAMRGDDGPLWSPDGRWLAYVFDGRLWRVAVDADGEIAGAPIAMTDGPADAPSWRGDSTGLVYRGLDGLREVMLDGRDAAWPINLTYAPSRNSGTTVVRAGRLFDGISGAYRENVDVVVDGHRIAAIEPVRDRGPGVRVIDASGQTVIPGLIESHTHQAAPFGARLGRLWLAMGVTSVREPGTDPFDALERRESWTSGRRPGPRQFYAGALTDGARVFYGMAQSVVTPEHLEREMARAQALDYDMIKTYVRMSDPLQKMVVARAHAIGLPVSSHEIYPAVAYGVDGVEHLRGTSRRGYSPKQSELAIAYDDVVGLLAASGMTITPTITLQGGFNRSALRDAAVLRHPAFLALFREDERAALAAGIERQRAGLASLDRSVGAMHRTIRDIVARGGRVLAGTDSPFVPYGLSFLVELQNYAEAGVPPADVLRSATAWPADFLGLGQQLGTLAPGRLADLVVIDGDPLARIADLANVAGVMVDGRYRTRADLLNSMGSE
ncbi:MAG: amidohydrolase family protein [Rhodospirillaceae bacterium]|nr:amidohydrolase family protein [Rhodospirillaceae bacterium]